MDGLGARAAKAFVSFVLPDIRKFAPQGTPVIEPAPDSVEGKVVPEVIIQEHPGFQILKLFLVFPHLMRTAYYARRSRVSVRRNPAGAGRMADASFFRELEDRATGVGVSAIGYTQVPREYIFSNKEILFENAVVLIMGMDKGRIERAPGIEAGREVWRTYAELSKAVYVLSEFMRQRGYAVQPDPPVGGSTNFPLLAQKAGLGWIGRHGLLISEGNGPSQRIAAIYTDIGNLPFTDHRAERYLWISDFCEACGRCIRECPAAAIYPEPVVVGNGHKRCIDYKRCVKVFSKTLGCSVCIKACTFFRGDFSRIKRAFVTRDER